MVRHGFMIVGPTGSGKTSIANLLTEALTGLNRPHKIIRLNPKVFTYDEMYGVKCDASNDWTPGVFTNIWKSVNESVNDTKLPHSTWIVCDGPVDAIWVEQLNSVLDDNKML